MLEGLLTNQLNSGLDHVLAGLTQAQKTQANEEPLIAAGRHSTNIQGFHTLKVNMCVR
jgi:hypothetical protein